MRLCTPLSTYVSFMFAPMQNSEVLRELKFGIGDGQLHYYLYNWRVASPLGPNEVGLILM